MDSIGKKRNPKYYRDIQERRDKLKNNRVKSLPNEKWVDLVGYEGHYQISNLSRIKSLYRLSEKNDGSKVIKPEQLRKLTINGDGYFVIALMKDRKRRQHGLHNLMAQTFIKNIHNFPEVNHKDGNKLNCLASNLEWVTHKYNMSHAIKNGLRKYAKGINNGRYKIPVDKIKDIYLDSNGTLELAKKYGVTRSAIQRIKNGKTYKSITSGLDKY